MNRTWKAIVVAGLLLTPAGANAALTVTPGLTVHNQCAYDVTIAIRYKDSRGFWATAPFTSIRGRERKEAVISTDNSIIYYYAESSSGVRWSGDHNVNVGGKTYPMKEMRLTLNQDRNRYYLGLTCTN
jgi:hypothetical protein